MQNVYLLGLLSMHNLVSQFHNLRTKMTFFTGDDVTFLQKKILNLKVQRLSQPCLGNTNIVHC